MEPQVMMTSSVAIITISLAVFVFLIPKANEIIKTRWKSMLSIDMPYHVLNNARFRLEILLDTMGMYFLALAFLTLGSYFTTILANTAAIYFEKDIPFAFLGDLPTAFINGVRYLGLLMSFIIVVIFLWFTAGYNITKKLPIMIKVYAQIVLDTSRPVDARTELMEESKKLLLSNKYDESILHSITALEYELRKKLNLDTKYSFSAVISKLANAKILGIDSEELNKIIIMRKNITRPYLSKHITSINIKREKLVTRIKNNILRVLTWVKNIILKIITKLYLEKKKIRNQKVSTYGENLATEIFEQVEYILRQLDYLGVSTIYQ